MTRQAAIARAIGEFDSGAIYRTLGRRVAMPTVSLGREEPRTLAGYIEAEVVPALAALGFTSRLVFHENWPFLIAERIESAGLPTVLCYAHGDVVPGMEAGWQEGLSPWQMTERDGVWFGRGTADNKGQHTINFAALAAVLETRGRLGFNAKLLFEMGEEVGSPGLHAICAEYADALAADVLIASDGPRLGLDRPTVFLGSRGNVTFDLSITARQGGQHSGNWGGLLSDPAAQLAHAITTIVSPTGRINVEGWRPDGIPASVRAALANCPVEQSVDGPRIDPDWGEPGLTLSEKLYAWPSFAVIAAKAGDPAAPANAIVPGAWARCQLRTVVGINEDNVLPALRQHLDAAGFGYVDITLARAEVFRATRLDPDHPWVKRIAASIGETTGMPTAVLPNLGGSLPNDAFSVLLGLPTIWVPHSYPGCSQHAPNEHVPVAIVREGLAIMAGIYWDLGEA